MRWASRRRPLADQLLGGVHTRLVVVEADEGHGAVIWQIGLDHNYWNAGGHCLLDRRNRRGIPENRNNAVRLLGDGFFDGRSLGRRVPVLRAGALDFDAELLRRVIEPLVGGIPIWVS